MSAITQLHTMSLERKILFAAQKYAVVTVFHELNDSYVNKSDSYTSVKKQKDN